MVGFIAFPLALRETLTASPRIWIQIAVFNSDDDHHYTARAFSFYLIYIRLYIDARARACELKYKNFTIIQCSTLSVVFRIRSVFLAVGKDPTLVAKKERVLGMALICEWWRRFSCTDLKCMEYIFITATEATITFPCRGQRDLFKYYSYSMGWWEKKKILRND